MEKDKGEDCGAAPVSRSGRSLFPKGGWKVLRTRDCRRVQSRVRLASLAVLLMRNQNSDLIISVAIF